MKVTILDIEACPKCGSREFSKRFHRGSYDCSYGRNRDKGSDGEHLHYTCQQCRYTWATPCLDAKKAPNADA